jgi:DNA ligase D-like protein (predicted 3'-phosphoesterase)
MKSTESLDDYAAKRQFDETPEPEPVMEDSGLQRFVVQEHHASHLHWDFRLEIDGVLKSWAVPKGVPEETGIRRLAVQTEDHPIGYIDFEGTIAEGQYGAGTVSIWDKGTFDLIERDEKRLTVDLHGGRLNGGYAIVHTRENQWIILRMKVVKRRVAGA